LISHYFEQTKAVSRKGAKAQRRRRKEQAAFNSLACFLCATSAFARDFFSSLNVAQMQHSRLKGVVAAQQWLTRA
jgi:hypothetical protein